MASDEDNYHCEDDNLPKSKIGGLILQINKMLKKPVIDFDLDKTLDTFLNQLNEAQQYLSNGIFNVKFAEAGLFLQSSAALYSKKVDLLWDTALEYQMQLCTYTKSAEGKAIETTKIAQRMNRNKRKKTVAQETDPNCHLNENLMGVLNRSHYILESCDSSPYYEELKNRWKAHNETRQVEDQHSSVEASNEQTQNEKCKSPLCDIQFPINKDIINIETGEKLSKYSDIHLNCAVPCLEAGEYVESSSAFLENVDNNISCYKNDWLLQRYLKQRQLTYKMLWTQELGDNFAEFRKNYREEPYVGDTDVALLERRRISVVNLTRLPNELMAEYEKHNDIHVRTLIQELLLREKQSGGITSANPVAHAIKKGSERISDADSAFHDEAFHDAEYVENNDPLHLSQQSTADSGICCSGSTALGDSGIFSQERSGFGDNESTYIEETITNGCSVANVTEPEQSSDQNNKTGDVKNDMGNNDSINTNADQQHSKGAQLEGELEPNIEVIGRNECVETVELPPFLPIHNRSIIKPERNNRAEKETLKRKLLKDNNSEEKKEKRRRTTFRWLKTTSTTLKKFEKFFMQHYEPQFGEADEDRIVPLLDYSDDDTESIFSDLVAPDLDDGNEETENTDFDTFESRVQDSSLQIPVENDSILKESDLNSTLNKTEGDQNVPDNVTNRTSEPVYDSADIKTSNFQNTTELSVSVPTSSSTKGRCESSTIERLKVVTEWRKFIEPKLQEAENNLKFDIHEYGTCIMDAIPPEKNLNFQQLVQGKQASEVVRFFLASLQLANTYNVELSTPTQGELANDKLELKLLTRERYHEHLDEYEAPSENSFREKLARIQALHSSRPVHSTPARHPVNAKPQSKRQKLSYL